MALAFTSQNVGSHSAALLLTVAAIRCRLPGKAFNRQRLSFLTLLAHAFMHRIKPRLIVSHPLFLSHR
jgi:hypothetical protein